MSRRARYEPLDFNSRAQTLSDLASGDMSVATTALLGAAEHSEEPEWVEAAAIALTLGANVDARRAGLLALSALLRRFGERINVDALRVALARIEAENELAGTVSDVRDDVDIYARR